MSRETFDDLVRFYERVDAEVARCGWSCRACGDCCRFAAFGHELYCSEAEADYLLRDADAADLDAVETCPFLHENSCGRRDRRTLSCRTYYCAGASCGTMAELTERLVSELKTLHMKWGRPWRYLRLGQHIDACK